MTQEVAQRIVEDEMRKKPVSASRIIKVDGYSLTTAPIDPLYKEAAGPLHCKRQP